VNIKDIILILESICILVIIPTCWWLSLQPDFTYNGKTDSLRQLSSTRISPKRHEYFESDCQIHKREKYQHLLPIPDTFCDYICL